MFTLDFFVQISAQIIEVAGILSMLGGAVVAGYLSLRRVVQGWAVVYRSFRQGLGKAILLGLELLVAGDIIRTVSHMPSFEEVSVLAVIVLIRTFLSFTLQVELEGRLPWKSEQPVTPPLPGSQE